MSTLMSTGNSSGETGRCDAKCYGAKTKNCHCCCGGRNHGVGLNQAIQNTTDYANEMIEDWKKEHPDDSFTVTNVLF
jgi:hypothetical protein